MAVGIMASSVSTKSHRKICEEKAEIEAIHKRADDLAAAKGFRKVHAMFSIDNGQS